MNMRFFDSQLARLGYSRRKSGIYVFDASSPHCNHLLFVEVHGKADRYITADFCLLNADAERFALDALRKHGDPVFRTWANDASRGLLVFSVGEYAGWSPGAALWQRQSSEEEFAERFAQVIDERIVPITRQIESLGDLLCALLSNTSLYKWIKSNGAIRAAEIAFLASRLGMPDHEIRSRLQPYLKEIEIGLGARCAINASNYVNEVIAMASPTAMH
jgi:hypothetical protein